MVLDADQFVMRDHPLAALPSSRFPLLGVDSSMTAPFTDSEGVSVEDFAGLDRRVVLLRPRTFDKHLQHGLKSLETINDLFQDHQ
jgi:hypothetical protein